MPTIAGPILITGCSSGIGRATAARLLRAGHRVYATARRPEVLADLAAAGASTLPLDVTDEQSMVDAVAAVGEPVAVLVNNAGYGEYGPVEEVALDRVRRQFETNVFGSARLAQLVLPGMRAAGRGRIVNVSSMGGRVTFPLGGYYHASKFAMEALSDVLRAEVAQFGVRVVLIEPGAISTEFNTTIERTMASESAIEAGPYGPMKAGMVRALADPLAARISGRPEHVAKAIERACTARRPRTRYVITPAARGLILTRRLGGDRLWDAVSTRMLRR